MFLSARLPSTTRFICHAIKTLYHQLLPTICILCGRSAERSPNICEECLNDLPILPQSCTRCAQFLPFPTSTDLLCGTCLQNPPPFDSTYALFRYQKPIIKLIIALKFKGQLSHARTLGVLLAQKLGEEWYAEKKLPDVIMPIPLHPIRLRERGFNQALEIARPIAKLLRIPLDFHSVKRIKNTSAQSELPASLRKSNIANAFISNVNFKNQNIAVIDDVITTSYTMREFCKVLKHSNAKSIHVWCCARSHIALDAKTL